MDVLDALFDDYPDATVARRGGGGGAKQEVSVSKGHL